MASIFIIIAHITLLLNAYDLLSAWCVFNAIQNCYFNHNLT